MSDDNIWTLTLTDQGHTLANVLCTRLNDKDTTTGYVIVHAKDLEIKIRTQHDPRETIMAAAKSIRDEWTAMRRAWLEAVSSSDQ